MPWMSGNVVRNLLSRPATRLYPAVKREPPEGSRGRILFDSSRCEFCGDCERVCPAQAISLDTELAEGYEGTGVAGENRDEESGAAWVRVYDPFRCIFCNLCIEACAYGALMLDNHHLAPACTKTPEKSRIETW